MNWKDSIHSTILSALSLAVILTPFRAIAQNEISLTGPIQTIPNTNQQITPYAPRGARFQLLNPGLKDFPRYVVGQAVTTVVSPNQSTLLILTSGYNLLNAVSGANQGTQISADSTEYVFIFDISHKVPVQTQVIQVPNTYNGITFDPTGTTFYVAGGVDDDIHIYDLTAGVWAERVGSPIALDHEPPSPNPNPLNDGGVGLEAQPCAAGVAITGDGTKLVVANYYNDSITVLQKSSNTWTVASQYDLRPGKINSADSGTPGGEYPFWVVIKGNSTAYVSSIRDREIDVVNIAGTPSLITRIHVTGQPLKMTLNAAQTALYVAEDESDTVAVIDTGSNTRTSETSVGAPIGLLPASRAGYTGNNTNSVTLSPDQSTLYVTNGNTNNVAVVSLAGGTPTVMGLIPTGWYPNSVSLSGDGSYMYVINGKSPTGPNPGYCHGDIVSGRSTAVCNGSNQYDLQLVKAGFASYPTPAAAQLPALSQQVALNNGYQNVPTAAAEATMAAVRSKIKHVIYIIKENRTYDQILGDLSVGNGDPSQVEFGQGTTPNLHALARNFVDLDNFYDRSEVSMDGWPWTVSARAPDVVERQVTVNYAGRGLTNDSEGTNRNVNVSYPTLAQRLAADPASPNDPDVLPGTTDTAAPDGPDDSVNEGYIWDDALRAKLSVRDYGFFIDLARYNVPAPDAALGIPELTNPFASGTTVAYSTNADLRPYTDPYFRGFDNSFPDYWRFTEWQREFNNYVSSGSLPQLSLVRFMHDHTGNFSTSINGVNTPELDEADNDYAVGLLVQTIANSPYKDNTLIFVIEDDSQDGGDHVDSHRSVAFIVGPYVKQRQVVSTAYNTVDFLRTIEEVLGLPPLNLNDSLATPMADVFDLNQTSWKYSATPSSLLAGTTLPITFPSGTDILRSTHDANHWAEVTKGMDFSVEDHFDFNKYNHILWKGLMGDKPYPETSSGLDLRRNRAELLSRYRQQQDQKQKQQKQTADAPVTSKTTPGGL